MFLEPFSISCFGIGIKIPHSHQCTFTMCTKHRYSTKVTAKVDPNDNRQKLYHTLDKVFLPTVSCRYSVILSIWNWSQKIGGHFVNISWCSCLIFVILLSHRYAKIFVLFFKCFNLIQLFSEALNDFLLWLEKMKMEAAAASVSLLRFGIKISKNSTPKLLSS